jgi:hypothetical protein
MAPTAVGVSFKDQGCYDYSRLFKNELPQSIKKGAGSIDVIILYCYGETHT